VSKYTINMDDYEPPTYDEYDGEDPRPGWYVFELADVLVYDADDNKLQWVFKVVDEPYKGWPGMMFANDSSTKWINQQIAIAIQGGAEKPLAFDPEDEKSVAALVKRAKRVKGKVEKRTYNEETRLSLRKVRPLLEEAGSTSGRGRSRASAAEDLTPEPTPEEAPAEGNDEPYTQEELDAMPLEDLAAILKDDYDMEVPAKGRRESEDDYAAKLADLILAAQEAEGGEDVDGNADDFGDGAAAFEEPAADPEPEPATTRRRRGAAAKAAPEKAAPAKAAAAPATRRRRA
jgi:hypothetical protein